MIHDVMFSVALQQVCDMTTQCQGHTFVDVLGLAAANRAVDSW